ncbi:MAG: NAD(P)H-hydrate dehydratase [Chloroflexi bacterium]|nr:NAD(P)H-hydrate dehydratase [Chloroflexota bacterium]
MRVIDAATMRELERRTDAQGHSYAAMMELAGQAVAQAAAACMPKDSGRVLVLVGPGNNGGDGLVAAHWLHTQGYTVSCYLLRERPADDPQLVRVCTDGIPVSDQISTLPEMLSGCGLVLDALFGTGLHGVLRDATPEVLEIVRNWANAADDPAASVQDFQPCSQHARPKIVAVDLPSGVDADSGAADAHTLSADLTVTFGHPKNGHFIFPGAQYVGDLRVADIGLAALEQCANLPTVATPQQVRAWLPKRPAQANKGTFGSVLVVGGCASYRGAPRLVAEAAYRSGAGLVSVAAPALTAQAVAGQLPEVTFIELRGDSAELTVEDAQRLAPELGRYHALLVGPGMSSAPQSAAFWEALLEQLPPDTPLVVDADGLNLLARQPDWHTQLPSHTVLTPHPGEMARLCGMSVAQVQRERWALAREMARSWGVSLVLKGAYSVCASPQGELTVIPFANPLLSVAGTGDVLAGLITGLLAQGMPTERASIAGCYLHALAGQRLSERLGSGGLLAHELAGELPRVIQVVRGASSR